MTACQGKEALEYYLLREMALYNCLSRGKSPVRYSKDIVRLPIRENGISDYLSRKNAHVRM